jgi:hypothetical protein
MLPGDTSVVTPGASSHWRWATISSSTSEVSTWSWGSALFSTALRNNLSTPTTGAAIQNQDDPNTLKQGTQGFGKELLRF